MSVKPIQDGYPIICPYLIVEGAAGAIDYYTKVLGGKERFRMPMPNGRIGHAEIEFGPCLVMLADDPSDDSNREWTKTRSPTRLGATSTLIVLHVDNVDAIVSAAVSAGAKIVQPVETKFYGDRSGSFQDPWGHVWTVTTHVEDVSPEEMQKRMEKLQSPQQ